MNLGGIDACSTLCFVQADLSGLSASAVAQRSPNGKKYWTIVFTIELYFGLTELKARIKWNQDVCFGLLGGFSMGRTDTSLAL